MSSLNRICYNPKNDQNNIKSFNNNKLSLNNNKSQKTKFCSSNDMKMKEEDRNIKLINNNINSYNYINNINKNNIITNRVIKNKPNKIQKKNCFRQNNNNNQNFNKNIKKGGLIESYPSIISTDTLTIKNNNINLYKKNATEFIVSFNPLNNDFKKDSSSINTIKNDNYDNDNDIDNDNDNDNDIIIENNENKNNSYKFIKAQKFLSDVTTADKENSKISKSEKNKIKKNFNRFKHNINKKDIDIDKIKLDIKFDNNSEINEIDENHNYTNQKNKNKFNFNEPEFIKEIKEKNIIKLNNISLKDNNDTYILGFDYSSNTSKNKINKNNKFDLDLESNIIKNDISNYKTYFKDIDNNNNYILSPIIKNINSIKNNRISKIFGNPKQLQNLNEDDIDTVKQDNTFRSKIESITSETIKNIQSPKNGLYFFEAPEEQNYNHIQGPIEFEYDNSSEKGTINNKDEYNCSKLNNIHILKIEKKDINIEDENVNYYDNMKENDDIMSYKNIDIHNIINNNNNCFNSISSNNEKTLSNNCSYNNFTLNNKKNNNNNILITEITRNEQSNKNAISRNTNDIDKDKEIKIYKKIKSYQKKIIKNTHDLNKAKSFKTSTKINQNFSEEKQKRLLLYRLKNYKIEYFVGILQKIINNYYKRTFNKFKNINVKLKEFILLIEKIYIIKSKNKLMNILIKYINKKRKKNFPFFLPFKNYPFNKVNCITLNIDNNNQTNPVSNDNDTLNNSCNIYYDNNNISTIRNHLTQNDIKKQAITNSSVDKTDSYFYIKKLIYQKNTIPFSNINNVDKNDYIKSKNKLTYKKEIIPKSFKKNPNILYHNIFNNKIYLNINKKNEQDNDNEDDILEQAYKYKLLDEDRYSNGIFHISKDNNSQKKNDSLKEYFFREVEKLEFPDSNMDNLGQENVEETNSY